MRQERDNAQPTAEPGLPMRRNPQPPARPLMGSMMMPLMPGPQLYHSLVQHREAHADLEQALEHVVDQRLRDAARRSVSAAPSTLTSAVRASISRVRIAPPPPPPMPLAKRASAGLRTASRRAQRAARLTDAQWRAAIGSLGTLMVAVVFGGVSIALDPGELFALLGLGGALLLSVLAFGHLLSAVVGAVMSSAALALVAVGLYVGLAAVWVRLMRHPVEA